MARKALSKKDRFEIFKRDGFVCQYCGKQPPGTTLQVDHIIPVSKGGDNDPMNLITSCQECNIGKSNNPLEQISPKPDADLEWLQMQQDIVELRRYQLAKDERDKLTALVVKQLQETWHVQFDDDLVPLDAELQRWLSWAEPDQIEYAIQITAGKIAWKDFDDRLRYTAGVLHNVVKDSSQ